MKHKFNIGDKVRVLDGSKIKDYTGFWAMKEYVGKEAVIIGIVTYSDDRFGYKLRNCGNYTFDERGLKLVSSEKKTGISIYRKDKKVIARDEETGKTGVAKCSPDDAFDFMTGAKLALERLSEQHPKHKFKVGDGVIGNEAANKEYSITRAGWVGRVVSVDEDGEFAAKGECLFAKAGVFSGLSESCFDLYGGLVPGDKVKVANVTIPRANVIEKVTALTDNDNYRIRFAFNMNRGGLEACKTFGTTLTVIAVDKDYALVTKDDDAPVYIASVKDLTRC